MSAFEDELKLLLIDALMLEDVAPGDLEPDAPLFDTLGLDSIDALEIAMIVKREYGVQLQADDERNKAIFATLRSLATYVDDHRESS